MTKTSDKFANNPQTFMNSYLSGMRNTIITLTLGIGIYGFSKTFNTKKADLIMRMLSVVMYGYSLTLCVNTNLMFRSYIKKLEKENPKDLPGYIELKYWRVYEILGWVFSFILICLFLLAGQRFLSKLVESAANNNYRRN